MRRERTEEDCVRDVERCIRLAHLPATCGIVACTTLSVLVVLVDHIAPCLGPAMPWLLAAFLACEWLSMLLTRPARRWLDRRLGAALRGLTDPDSARAALRALRVRHAPGSREVALRKVGELLPNIARNMRHDMPELDRLCEILAATPKEGYDATLIAVLHHVAEIGYTTALTHAQDLTDEAYSVPVRRAARVCVRTLARVSGQTRFGGLLIPAELAPDEPLPLRVAPTSAMTAAERRAGLSEGAVE